MFELNPILVKELRSRMRGPRAFILISVYLLVLSGAALLLYMAMAHDMSGNIDAGRQIGKALFLIIGAVTLTQVCLISPSLTSGSIAGERERQSYDLLIASPLSPWQIVMGKLASALAFALLLVFVSMPLMAMAFLFGGVSLTELLIILVALVATCIFYASIGMFWSAVMRSPLGASSFALGSVLLMLLGIPFLIFVFGLIFWRGSSNPLGESVFFIHMVRLALASHPFIALGFSESVLSEGGDPWFEQVSIGSQTVAMPNLWILYMFIALIGSVLLILMSVRAIRPERSISSPSPKQLTTPVEIAESPQNDSA